MSTPSRENERTSVSETKQLLKKALHDSASSLVADRKQRAQDIVHLFLSLDLVGSTNLKTSKNWIGPLGHFFDAATSYARDHGYRIWKYRGDEALFFKELDDSSNLHEELQLVYCKITTRLNRDFQHDFRDGTSPKTKTTMWVAPARHLPRGARPEIKAEIEEIENRHGSVIMTMGQDRPAPVFEFLGLGIDAGFRIAEVSHPYAIAISIQLAHLMLTHKEKSDSLIRIVGYRTLRGVSDEPFPILWYSPNWTDFKNNVEETACKNRTIYEAAAIDLKHSLSLESCRQYVERLKLDSDISHISRSIKNIKPRNNELIEGYPISDRHAEVHCVAICFNDQGEVLIGKRTKKEDSPLSEKWEFGCAQLKEGLTFEEAIRIDYRHDFGVDIEAVCPDPVTTYVIPGKNVGGVIFVAKVIDSSVSKNNKHQDHIWSHPEMVSFKEDECVPNFSRTLDRATEIYKEWNNELRLEKKEK